MLTKLTSVCVAVHDLQEAIDRYCELFGLQLMKPISAPTQLGFRNAWLGNGKDAFIEILESTDPKSAVARFLDSRGEGIYLVEFDVDDLPETVRHVRAKGGRITGIPDGEDPTPETRGVWVHPSSTRGVFMGIHPPGAPD
jgi:methylmalonyl-CoA/ethylmalonyl-CoA epimerase